MEKDFLEFLSKKDKENDVAVEFMINTLDVLIKKSGNKKGILLKTTMQISQKDHKIVDYFMDGKNNENEKLENVISFYKQIDKLYDDLIKELEI